MRYGLLEDLILEVVFTSRAFVSLMTDRQDNLKRQNKKYDMQRLCVTLSVSHSIVFSK